MSGTGRAASGARRARWSAAGAVLVALVWSVAPATAAAPAAAQSTRPAAGAAQPSEIQKQFEQLADADAEVRDAARTALMGLGRDELPLLRALVEKSRPLQPSQAAVLRDIVIHVYLAGDAERSPSNQGFLGVRLDPSLDNRMMMLDEPGAAEGHSLKGVMIRECMPGFSGFRFLRDGDVILGIMAPVQMRTPEPSSLIAAISAVSPGNEIRLELLRHGRIVQVSFAVSARPIEAHDAQLTEDLLRRRSSEAEEYWKKNFSELVESRIS